MSEKIDVNKIGDDQKKDAGHLSETLQDKGMGRDHADQVALETVAQEHNSGGHNTAGDAKKGADQRGAQGDSGGSFKK